MALFMMRYVLPFNMSWPEGYAFVVRIGPMIDARVTCHSIKVDEIVSYRQGEYSWLSTDAQVHEGRVKVWNGSGDEYVARKWRYYPGEDLLTGGVIDPVVYTVMEVAQRIRSKDELQDSGFVDALKKGAMLAMRRTLSIYRLVSQDTRVTLPDASNLTHLDALVSANEKLNGPEITADFEPFDLRVQWNDPFKRGCVLKPLHEEKVTQMAELLRSDGGLMAHEELLLEAKELGNTRGNHRLAVVVAESGFEVYLQTVVSYLCQELGKKQLVAGDIEKPYQEVVESSTAPQLLRIVCDLTGKNIRSEPCHNKWDHDAYKLRHDIVHHGRRDITEKMGEAAFLSIVKYIDRIEELVSITAEQQ